MFKGCCLVLLVALYLQCVAGCTYPTAATSCGPANTIVGSADSSAIVYGSSNKISLVGHSFIGAGVSNVVQSNLYSHLYAFIGAGTENLIRGGTNGFIGSGYLNSIINTYEYRDTESMNSAIVGGQVCTVSGSFSFIGGGFKSYVTADYSVVAGGQYNSVTGASSSILGGNGNSINGYGYSVIAGGLTNTIAGTNSFIGGGANNNAGGTSTVIPGGEYNTATGVSSFAAGFNASDNAKQGCFVWNDKAANTANLKTQCSANNQFVARSSGGFYFFTNAGRTTGALLLGGSGTWSNLCDRNLKEKIVELNYDEVLEKFVNEVPVTTWSYSDSNDVKHMGPMAQDFYAAFGLGAAQTHIDTVDMAGVAFASIHALNNKIKQKEQENKELKDKLDDILDRVDKLEKALDRLSRREL